MVRREKFQLGDLSAQAGQYASCQQLFDILLSCNVVGKLSSHRIPIKILYANCYHLFLYTYDNRIIFAIVLIYSNEHLIPYFYYV